MMGDENKITLPVELSHTHHKHGGRILRIEKIAHEIAKPSDGRSRDIWFFIGDVSWSDGGLSSGHEIAPWALAYGDNRDGAQKEINQLSQLLNEYLLAHGKFYEDGPHEGWYANNRKQAKAAIHA
jgi:hypothetical protein